MGYRLSLQGEEWKVTDVSVMGVWLVSTYQSQFAQVLQTSGVDGLIQTLAAKARARRTATLRRLHAVDAAKMLGPAALLRLVDE